MFENNDERLWARLRTAISIFLNDYRNRGGLRGTTEAEAFFVKIDAENNTNSTIANGEVHIEVGVALEYPAEFIVITLSQKTSV
jgi:phage tail sheath protein FI